MSNDPTAGDGSVALAHDYLLVMRGAERTFAEICACYPDAPIFTTVYSEAGTGGRFAERSIRPSPLQWLRPDQAWFRRLLPLYPTAVARLPTDRFPVVLSSSSAFAIGVPRAEDGVHLCYCHTPFRYAWHERDRALTEVPAALRPVLRGFLARQRRWDRRAADRVTTFIANSAFTRERIAAVYGRDAQVIHPPVELGRFRPLMPGAAGEHVLVVSELVAHKRVELALEAAMRAGRTVRVVGDGPELAPLRRRFGSITTFLGRLPDGPLAAEYASAAALLVTAPEEFGIVSVEAQAAGRPVVAFAAGGVPETLIPGLSGELIPDGDVDAMADALSSLDFGSYDSEAIAEAAARFSPERFRREFSAAVTAAVASG